MEKFVVSARKYRPSDFKSVVGQEHITSTLVNAIARNQLAHAYLFCGPRGVGKTTCARIIAKAINCLNPTDTHEACGVCDSCRAFDENSSFNIYELDAASNNSVDNIRSLIDQVRIPPQVGKYAIYIIDEVHMLTTAAFNAFLKTLEEPPSYVIFILATTEKHKILPTILSRCQVYEFKHIGVEDIVGYLKYIASEEGVTYDEESFYVIAQKADGCMRDALSMYDKVVTFCNSQLTMAAVASALNILDYDTYFTFADLISASDYGNALLSFDNVLKRGFDSQTFLSGLSRHFRDLLVASSPSTLSLLCVTGALATRYSNQSRKLNIPFIFGVIDIINSTESNIKFSLNQRLVAELAIMKMCNMSAPVATQIATTSVVSEPAVAYTVTPSAPVALSAPVTPVAAVNTPVTVTSPVADPIVNPVADPVVVAQVTKAVDVANSSSTDKVVETPKVDVPKTKKGKGLGLPRLNTMTTKTVDDVVENNDTNRENIDVANYIIPESDNEKILAGCKLFASKISQRSPRIAIAFDNARIEGGKLFIPVPNKMLQDEINNKKAQTISPLSRLAAINIYDFTVLLEQAAIEDKKIIIGDEDKYKYLLEENAELHKLTENMNLHFN